MNTWVWVVLLLLLVGAIGYYLTPVKDKPKQTLNSKLYQGPVPEGYDESHFRKTGVTIPNG